VVESTRQKLITLFATLSLLAIWNLDVHAQVAVIANKEVPADSVISTQLLDFYSGETRHWENGLAVTVFDLKPRDEIKSTFYKFLGKTSSRMKSIWLVNMLSGESDPPESVQSEDDMLKKVATTQGAIGFVRQSKVNGDVKVLAVIEEIEK
jgi:ABC-type phosphate transport system substrate-binding protein